ncbi:MAG: MJ0042-type zinc finger domain-containing protein [Pseudolabrys sp.]
MLIVCPSCASSYMIDQAAVGPAGRTVRCARCKASWLAGGPKAEPDVTAIVDNVIAEAEGEPAVVRRAATPPPAASVPEADAAIAEPAPSNSAAENGVPAELPGEPVPAPAEVPAIAPEPVAVADAPSLVPPIEHEPLPEAVEPEPDTEAADEAESFDTRRLQLQARRKKSRRSSRWTAVILVLAAFNVALIGARNDVVRYLPQTASLFAAVGLPVNLRGLKFENVTISKEAQDGGTVLTVAGAIASESGKAVEVPGLRFAARNATGQEVYTWTMPPPRSILGPGERLQFRSQIPAPPADANNVLVRFLNASDVGAK